MKKIKTVPFLLILGFTLFAGICEANSASTCSRGQNLEVLWHDKWYAAYAIKGKGDQCYIHYDGYGNNWDEWVGPERMRMAAGGSDYRSGDAVQVLWKGSWYNAHVLQAKGSQLKIHYDGYGHNWDEWVGPGRYR